MKEVIRMKPGRRRKDQGFRKETHAIFSFTFAYFRRVQDFQIISLIGQAIGVMDTTWSLLIPLYNMGNAIKICFSLECWVKRGACEH